MKLQLHQKLIEIVYKFEIKFTYNDKFYIDFMDFFPLLKKGITTIDTLDKIFHVCKEMNKSFDNLFNYFDDFNDLSSDSIKIISTNVSDDLLNEEKLANSLLNTYELMGKNDNNDLILLMNSFNPKIIISTILNKALETPSLRLFSNIIYNNTEDMAIALYLENIDFYDIYKDLYILAISHNNIKIANMIKEIIILKKLYIKKVLKINFESLIHISNIPDIIYNIIYKFLE